jgi:hypothetical protein
MDAPFFQGVAKEAQHLVRNYRHSIMRVPLVLATFYDWASV